MKHQHLDKQKEMYWDYDYPATAEDIYRFILGETDFYLTGGTALSRFHLNHR